MHPFAQVSEALAYLAYKDGARFVEHCGVQRVLTESAYSKSLSSSGGGSRNHHNIRVTAVETDKGLIKCKYFVNCAGIWARRLGQKCEPPVRVPIASVDHFFVTFQDMDDFAGGKVRNRFRKLF